jgi:hypothetical protein
VRAFWLVGGSIWIGLALMLAAWVGNGIQSKRETIALGRGNSGLTASGASQSASQLDLPAYFFGVWSGSTDGIWAKYEIFADGTYRLFIASAVRDDWPPEPSVVGTWTLRSGKFINTGEHYSYLDLSQDGMQTLDHLIPSNGGILRSYAGGADGQDFLTRGDHFPR